MQQHGRGLEHAVPLLHAEVPLHRAEHRLHHPLEYERTRADTAASTTATATATLLARRLTGCIAVKPVQYDSAPSVSYIIAFGIQIGARGARHGKCMGVYGRNVILKKTKFGDQTTVQ